MAQIINTDGTTQTVEPKNGTDFKLEELQEIVGGYIEIVDLNNGQILVINEEGKLNNLEVNSPATSIAHQAGAIYAWDCIVGNVLLCNSNQVR